MDTDTGRTDEHSGVAIIGIGVQLPSGDYAPFNLDYHQFWDFLLEKRHSGVPLTSVGLNSKSHIALPLLGSFLKNADHFDNVAFGISSKDARVMSRAHRRLLEVSFEALLDSGIDYRGRRIGCFVSGTNDSNEDTMDPEGSIASALSAMAARISYAFNLTGPSMTVDSACSSSLTGLHLACRAIEARECEAAVVGACQSNRRIVEWENYVQAKVLSPDGSSKPFDITANGFGRGEGAIAIVLKSETEAVRDGDQIYAVVKGTALSSTGSSSPLYVPNGETQADCIRTAYIRAGLSLSDVDYIELHATGTAVGDPIETNSLASLLSGNDREFVIGSVKGNIGHLECCAFLASLAKACLMFQHHTIPPNAHFFERNSSIRWEEANLIVPTESLTLGCRSKLGRSIISISSAGIGGSTGHVVLQGPSCRTGNKLAPPDGPILFLSGGLTPVHSEQLLEAALGHCALHPKDVTSTVAILARRARQFPYRSFSVLSPSSISPVSETMPASRIPAEPHSIVFVFSGQGPHHFNMGRELFARFPVFKATILELDNVYRQVCGNSLIETTGLFTNSENAPLIQLGKHGWPVSVTCPALAMVQIALFDLLQSFGLRPGALVGHSAGETPLVYASGAGSKALALEIAIARGRAMTMTESLDAGMAALACSVEQATVLISNFKSDEYGHLLSLACFNGPNSVTVSGPNILLDRLIQAAKDVQVFAQKIRTFVPGHSTYMETCKSTHISLMEDVFRRYPGNHVPRIPVYSTCTSAEKVQKFDADYYWSNCRNPVTFSSAISSVVHSNKTKQLPIFVEISPHPVLSSSIQAHDIPPTHTLCNMKRSSSPGSGEESAAFFATLGKLSVLGVNHVLFPESYEAPPVSRPWLRYPLASRPIPPVKTYSSAVRTTVTRLSTSPVLRHPRSDFKDLTQHVIKGEAIFPMTGFIELLLELGATYIWDLDLVRLMPLPPDGKVDVFVERDGPRCIIYTLDQNGGRRIHAESCMDSIPNAFASVLSGDSPEMETIIEADDLYASIQSVGNFGPLFRRVTRCRGGPSRLVVDVKALGSDESSENYVFHPAVLDACLHSMLHPVFNRIRDDDVFFLPAHLDSFTLHREPSPGENLTSTITLTDWFPDRRIYDAFVTDSTGSLLCSFRGLIVQHQGDTSMLAPALYDLIYQPVSTTVALPDDWKDVFDEDLDLPVRGDSSVYLHDVFRDTVMKIYAAGKRHLRVLEVGLDLEDMTHNLVDGLKDYLPADALVEYLTDDPTRATVVCHASHSVHSHYSRTLADTAQVQNSESPGRFPLSFDIIVTCNILRDSPDVRNTLDSMNALLVPGGFLFATESRGTVQSKSMTAWPFSSFGEDRTLWAKQIQAAGFAHTVYTTGRTREEGSLVIMQVSRPTPPKRVPVPITVLSYYRGSEMQLKEALTAQNIAQPRLVLLVAKRGPSSDAARGLIAALNQEYHAWRVRLIISDAPASHYQDPMPSLLALLESEHVIDIRSDNSFWVPRLVPALCKDRTTEGDSAPVNVPAGHVVVEVEQRTNHSNFMSFFGRITRSRAGGMVSGDFVVGITSTLSHAHTIIVPSRWLFSHSESKVIRDCDVFTALLGSLLIERLPFDPADVAGLDHKRILVSISNDKLANAIRLYAKYRTPHLAFLDNEYQLKQPAILLLTDTHTISHSPHILRAVSRKGRVVLWDAELRAMLENESIRLAQYITPLSASSATSSQDKAEVIPMPLTPEVMTLFKSDRAYILVGGLSSLGVILAIWMYQRGARYIVLTSRRGIKARSSWDHFSQIQLAYLQHQLDLCLRMEQCDGTNVDDVKALISDLSLPVGGIFLLAAVLSDALFVNQSRESFHITRQPKRAVLDVLARLMDIRSLDFIIHVSSISGLIGNTGQASYGSACTELDGGLGAYTNSFVFICPAIYDVGAAARLDWSSQRELKDFAISTETLCAALENGIRQLGSGSIFSHYIPALPNARLSLSFSRNMPPHYRHLFPSFTEQSEGPARQVRTDESVLFDIVLSNLGILRDDLAEDQPLVLYGLDSLGAAKLSRDLQPYASVTQLQLLAGMAFKELRALCLSTQDNGPQRPEVSAYEVVVKLFEGSGNPVVILHDITGSINTFLRLRPHVHCPIWAIQRPKSAEVDDLHALSALYQRELDIAIPHGPIRLASFSGSSILAVALAKRLEEEGRHILGLTFIDHFPAFWARAAWQEGEAPRDIQRIRQHLIDDVIDMLERDGETGKALAKEFAGARARTLSSDATLDMMHFLDAMTGMTVKLLTDFTSESLEQLLAKVMEWMATIRAPLSLVVATEGISTTLPHQLRDAWSNLGAEYARQPVAVHRVRAGHFQVLSDLRTAQVLQGDE